MTAVDAFYATPFPTYDELDDFVLNELPERAPNVRQCHTLWAAELGSNTHQLLQRIFDSKLNKEVVREVGIAINERGGFDAMAANFYIYCHFVGKRLKDMGLTAEQWYEMHEDHAKCIEYLWSGIGEWRA